jgi:endonuclease/exonuclease/phosphatase (EEP) superfamily protein YafD
VFEELRSHHAPLLEALRTRYPYREAGREGHHGRVCRRPSRQAVLSELQYADIVALTAFVQSRPGPLILAGDFNMAPWTVKLKTFTRATGLGRFNTFCPTWPVRRHDIRLLPILPIDNVFASRDFASINLTVGPYLGSDHLPVIADIALIE